MKQKSLEFLEIKHYKKISLGKNCPENRRRKGKIGAEAWVGLDGEEHPWSPQCNKGQVEACKSIRGWTVFGYVNTPTLFQITIMEKLAVMPQLGMVEAPVARGQTFGRLKFQSVKRNTLSEVGLNMTGWDFSADTVDLLTASLVILCSS